MKLKKIIIMSLLLVLCTSVIAVSITFAWFKNYNVNKVFTNDLQVSSSTVFLVSSTENGKAGTTLSYDLDGLMLDDITGDGINFTYVPLKSMKDAIEHGITYTGIYSSVPNMDSEWVPAICTDGIENIDTAQYISIDVYFQASMKANIYLGANSRVSPKTTSILGENAENKSAYGNFSKDCIAGAARVSIIDSDNPESCKIWIPNPTYELSYDYTTGWSMKTDDGTQESDYYYYNGEKEKIFLVGDNIYTVIPEGGVPVTTLSESETEPGKFVGHIKVNIWVEGCDREARRALAGGYLNIQLDFTAEEIVEDE